MLVNKTNMVFGIMESTTCGRKRHETRNKFKLHMVVKAMKSIVIENKGGRSWGRCISMSNECNPLWGGGISPVIYRMRNRACKELEGDLQKSTSGRATCAQAIEGRVACSRNWKNGCVAKGVQGKRDTRWDLRGKQCGRSHNTLIFGFKRQVQEQIYVLK